MIFKHAVARPSGFGCAIFGFFLAVYLLAQTTGCSLQTPESARTAAPRLLIKNASASVASLELTVSGPGFGTLELAYPAETSSISLKLPAGKDILFELTAYIDPSSPHAAVKLVGTATTDLLPQEEKTITLNMKVQETKIVIPDYMNNRVVQIRDISGAGWSELTGADLSSVGTLQPYDVDFDNQGRIYIANFNSGEPYIIRIDDITGTNEAIVVSESSRITALAIDRTRDYIYCIVNGSTLRRSDLTGGSAVTLDTSGLSNMRGVAIDEQGWVYVAYDKNVKCLNTGADYTVTGGGTLYAWDVLVKDSFVYLANNDQNATTRDIVLKLTRGLGLLSELKDKPGGGDSFYGPHRFVAVLNKKLYIVDEDEAFGSSEAERIVAIGDISGINWQDFDPSMVGQSAFNFYNGC